MLAGINAACHLQGKDPLILTRDTSYIGVMVDDLCTKGTDEPYRMMTSRSEYRLMLRQDNADLRLTQYSFDLGLASERRMALMARKRDESQTILQTLKTTRMPKSEARDAWLTLHDQPVTMATYTAEEMLRRPAITFDHLADLLPEFATASKDAAEQAELFVKYEGYLQKQQAQIARSRAMEHLTLPEDINYDDIESLRIEARQKLARHKPQSLSQASRIPGVNPADVAVLMVWLKRQEKKA